MKQRTLQTEWMDDFEVQGFELDTTLKDISKINRWLGGNQWTTQALLHFWKNDVTSETKFLWDVGCGNGDYLAFLAKKCMQKGIKYAFVGFDANPHTIAIAKERHKNIPGLHFECRDIFDEHIPWQSMDYLCCNLTLHHFENEKIAQLLLIWTKNIRKGFVINDLHRASLAIPLFKFVAWVFQLHPLSVADGLTSIQKGFRKNELFSWMKHISQTNYRITWRWAFRLIVTFKQNHSYGC